MRPPSIRTSSALIAGVIALAILSLPFPIRAEDAPAQEPVTVRKTKEGLHFNVPSDWPVEKRGGIMAPIPIEEYLARKFKSLEAQLQVLEQRLNGFDVRLRVLEEEAKKQRQGLRSSEPPVPSSGS